ncbi:MAG: hypothetical protein E7645_00300 [Ruminococcaceae bacterium]|nr:hypothetical protein [Oscillospiraceae bacterium]
MSHLTSLLQTMKQAEKYSEKSQFTTYLLRNIEAKRLRLTSDDKIEISTVAFAEISKIGDQMSHMTAYKEKDAALAYGDELFALITHCYPSPSDVPVERMDDLRSFRLTVDKERFVEREVDHVIGEGHHSKYEMEHLVEVLSPVKDEFQRGLLYNGLLHYKDKVAAIPDDAMAVLEAYIAAEIKRYLSVQPSEDVINALEVACDVCGCLRTNELLDLMYEVLKTGRANLCFYAVRSLLKAGKSVPDEALAALAADLEYASMTYSLLEQYGMLKRFPSAYAEKEYLAQSTMIRWLVYPTELGEMPEEIEYLGQVKKKELYYIFRFKSHSDNLEDARKGQWLIGWASEEGGTFSNFDVYAEFEQRTVEKTLKYIKRKLL